MTSARQQLVEAVRKTILDLVERRPVSELPADGTLGIVDNGTLQRWGTRRATARFKGGRWVRDNGGQLPFEPTVWVSIRKERQE